jgi:uncharacterized membrane protein YdjX (TVP38/TMEM64 family)
MIVVGVAIAAMLTLPVPLHQHIVDFIAQAEPVIARSPVLGAIVFVLLTAATGILVFFSSLLLVPVGVQVWGTTGCFLLLWCGWLLGGAVTYVIGRYLGRPAVDRMLSSGRVAFYEQRVPRIDSYTTSVLAQLALPSDISGYFFGMLKIPARIYLGGLMVAELPYALGTVFLGAAFVDRQYHLMLWVAALGLLVLAFVLRQRRMRNKRA